MDASTLLNCKEKNTLDSFFIIYPHQHFYSPSNESIFSTCYILCFVTLKISIREIHLKKKSGRKGCKCRNFHDCQRELRRQAITSSYFPRITATGIPAPPGF